MQKDNQTVLLLTVGNYILNIVATTQYRIDGQAYDQITEVSATSNDIGDLNSEENVHGSKYIQT